MVDILNAIDENISLFLIKDIKEIILDYLTIISTHLTKAERQPLDLNNDTIVNYVVHNNKLYYLFHLNEVKNAISKYYIVLEYNIIKNNNNVAFEFILECGVAEYQNFIMRSNGMCDFINYKVYDTFFDNYYNDVTETNVVNKGKTIVSFSHSIYVNKMPVYMTLCESEKTLFLIQYRKGKYDILYYIKILERFYKMKGSKKRHYMKKLQLLTPMEYFGIDNFNQNDIKSVKPLHFKNETLYSYDNVFYKKTKGRILVSNPNLSLIHQRRWEKDIWGTLNQ